MAEWPSRNALNAASKQSFRSILTPSSKEINFFPDCRAPLEMSDERGVPAMQFLLLCRSQIPWATSHPGVLRCSRAGLGPSSHVYPARLGLATAPTRALTARYSALFLRRSTMIPKNRTAKTAQTTRTVEASNIALSPFLTRINSTSLAPTFRQVLDIGHHGYQFADNLHGDRPHRHHEQRRQNAKKIGKISLTPSLAAFSSAT